MIWLQCPAIVSRLSREIEKANTRIRVNQQFRITFRWVSNDAYDVCCGDYH